MKISEGAGHCGCKRSSFVFKSVFVSLREDMTM